MVLFTRRTGRSHRSEGITSLRRPALAYIDGATGAMIFQMLFAAVVGVAVFWRTLWWRVKAFFGGSQPEETDASAQEPPADE